MGAQDFHGCASVVGSSQGCQQGLHFGVVHLVTEAGLRQLRKAALDLLLQVAVVPCSLDHLPAPGIAAVLGRLIFGIDAQQLADSRHAVRELEAGDESQVLLLSGPQGLLQKVRLSLRMPQVDLDSSENLENALAPIRVSFSVPCHLAQHDPALPVMVKLGGFAGCLQLLQALVQPLLPHAAQVTSKAGSKEHEEFAIISLHEIPN
mmetsp:Transcript_41527/g.96637  ORF Transcript_41527/g.96637 Transcript_41527/m.96637 type:complete len:206 (+) Transcript_41527:2222-2839(+)